jgi:hypothetical protein
MSPLPIAVWQESLDRMETALAAATKALDRAEERWEMAAAPSAGEGEPPAALVRLDARLQELESRLRSVAALSASVEVELADRAGEVGRWRVQFAKWQELLQQWESTSPRA